MAFDETLAERIRVTLGPRDDVREQKMFGGIAFMIRGHMAVGVIKDELMLRVAAEDHERTLSEPHARVMDFSHRTMEGFLYVAPEGIASDDNLARWVGRAVAYAETRPPK